MHCDKPDQRNNVLKTRNFSAKHCFEGIFRQSRLSVACVLQLSRLFFFSLWLRPGLSLTIEQQQCLKKIVKRGNLTVAMQKFNDE